MISRRNIVKQPKYRDFGITEQEYQLFLRAQPSPEDIPDDHHWGWGSATVFVIIWVSIPMTTWVVTGELRYLEWLWGSWFPALFFVPLFHMVREPLRSKIKRWKIRRSPNFCNIVEFHEVHAAYVKAQYEAERERQRAEQARLRRSINHWKLLGGIEFENELAKLYRQLGFAVKTTPRTGDQGIDLFLQKGGKTTIVQCKAHAKPVSPAVARELFGALTASGHDNAVLACPAGFTRGVKEFVKGKSIELVSASELVMMAENAQPRLTNPTLSMDSDVPVCPERGCGASMRLRMGRFGEFWGCERYLTCRGTREIR